MENKFHLPSVANAKAAMHIIHKYMSSVIVKGKVIDSFHVTDKCFHKFLISINHPLKTNH